jgi:hypothetical protein
MRAPAWVLKIVAWFRERYRPELHYMRGPGPKARAKQAERSATRPAGEASPSLER